ncbi:unnamed protein product, partial [Polarella glacialis]
MPLLMSAGAVGSAASAAAAGAFGYNRANYMFDNGLRFARYMAGTNFAEAQAAQYREDVRDLTEQTCAKQDLYHGLGVIFFVLNFQLIMAGRLGVHGPAPPEWILGIYWVNISSALMFLCTLTWLSLHAAARANAGSATLLTRSVRLPIPTPTQMDKARRTGNSFEKERASDIFRVPFAVPAPKDAIPEDDADKGTASKERRMPKWFQDEKQELHKGENGPPVLASSTPEHFELYRGLQQEWAAHDCYARIGILYLSCWMTSVSLYSQCHCFGELRALWPAWKVTALFCTSHYCVLQADIVESPVPHGKDCSLNSYDLRPRHVPRLQRGNSKFSAYYLDLRLGLCVLCHPLPVGCEDVPACQATSAGGAARGARAAVVPCGVAAATCFPHVLLHRDTPQVPGAGGPELPAAGDEGGKGCECFCHSPEEGPR